jgi:hypothetical protein
MARKHGWMEIEVEHDGRVFKADYAIINRSKAVTVATLRSCRSTECANQNPELAAKALLREMAAEGMA